MRIRKAQRKFEQSEYLPKPYQSSSSFSQMEKDSEMEQTEKAGQ